MNQIITNNIGQVDVQIVQSAFDEKEAALSVASVITEVTDQMSQDMAVNALQQIAKLTKAIEKSRKQVKEPVIDLGKKIDGMAKVFLAELTDEANRISALCAVFEKQKLDLLEAEEKKRRDAMVKLVIEQQNASEKRKVEIESQLAVSKPIETKTESTKMREVWNFEVMDIHALYAHDSSLVRMEPNRSAILVRLAAGSIPGIKAWKENKLSV